MQNILITGHTGYIGSMLKDRLQRTNNVILFDGDVTKVSDWEINLSKHIDIIYHLAAVEHTNTKADFVKDWSVNSLAVLQLYEACKNKNIFPKIIFTSSTNIFGNVNKTVVNENTREELPAIWSAHKLLGENYLRILNKLHNIKFTVLMLPNIYGPSASKELMNRMVVNKVIKQAMSNNEIQLYDNKSCLRDYLYIDDAIDAFELMLEIDKSYFNGSRFLLGANEKRTIEDVWKAIADQVPNTSIKYNNIKLVSIEYRNYISDITKFNLATGWLPKVEIKQGIQNTMKAYHNKVKRYQA